MMTLILLHLLVDRHLPTANALKKTCSRHRHPGARRPSSCCSGPWSGPLRSHWAWACSRQPRSARSSPGGFPPNCCAQAAHRPARAGAPAHGPLAAPQLVTVASTKLGSPHTERTNGGRHGPGTAGNADHLGHARTAGAGRAVLIVRGNDSRRVPSAPSGSRRGGWTARTASTTSACRPNRPADRGARARSGRAWRSPWRRAPCRLSLSGCRRLTRVPTCRAAVEHEPLRR